MQKILRDSINLQVDGILCENMPGGKKTQNLTHFESTRGLRGRKYLRNIFINGINPHKEQTSLNYGFVDFKNLTLAAIFAVPSRSHGALFITDT